MRQVILIPRRETDGFLASVPSLPGCHSQGDTVQEALENVRKAIDHHIETMTAQGEIIPDDVAPIRVVLL